jgi:pimeloyl-ACP methyl ester carboxylesterase
MQNPNGSARTGARVDAGSVIITVCCLAFFPSAFGAPAKPGAEGIKSLPPATQPLAAPDKTQLESAVGALERELAALAIELKDNPKLLPLLPDVRIYLNALRYPLVYREAIDVKKIQPALEAGLERAKALREGKAPWLTAGGPRGYLSKIDGSVQPYLLAVPKSYKPGEKRKYPVDIFCHGRGEDLLELKFINGKPGPAADKPAIADSFFVQPYGRYCCANKFAGEIDVLEILDDLKKQYPIDEDRIILTGFSMGGAAAWHLAVHYADLWCAASPGAGFCETKIYQNLAAKGELATTPWYEQTLWHWYDAPDYVLNLSNFPLIAYAGTDDPQQQSGTIMEQAAKEAGVKMERIWGQHVGHKYEPAAKKELDKKLDEYAAKGRNRAPKEIRFETRTLRYNRMFWMTVEGLDKHWRQTTVQARIDGRIEARTKNVAAIAFDFPAGTCPLGGNPKIEIDGKTLDAPAIRADQSFSARYEKVGGQWLSFIAGDDSAKPSKPSKRHGLQGPIDDAFLDRFIFILPTGKSLNENVGQWVKAESARAILQWHRIFRGEAIVKNDTDITEADIAESHLILWGDPSSNQVLAKIAAQLPVGWDAKSITLGTRKFDAATHIPLLIHPNPLNPKKYIVLNSGFTFREDANATNSRQVPKLPDYAVIDLSEPPSPHAPGKIAAAGFFGEKWELREDEVHAE